MKRIKVLFLLVFLLPIFAVDANACSCAGDRAPCEAYWDASAVFVGTVTRMRTYYPGVSDEARTTVVTVAEGQQVELSEMILPARFVEHTLKGIVVDESGRPVKDATVWLKEREYSDPDMPYRKETDSEGRFEFKTYLGINYHIMAYLEPEGGGRKQAEIEVRVSPNTETLKFVLRPK